MSDIKDTLYAYAAGIIDGEGSIGLNRITGDNRRARYTMRVTIGITDPGLPLFFQELFGGSVWVAKHTNAKHKDTWFWALRAKKAVPFLVGILPYLHIKRPQAELALRWQSRKHPRYTILTDHEMALEEADRILMLSYNKRGKEETK
ncbi:MAG: hypothetical protein Q8O55_06115 [Dehalococcoidales bacterium]|nr:hypothetical protein [Dehalococcoidales bacterium]